MLFSLIFFHPNMQTDEKNQSKKTKAFKSGLVRVIVKFLCLNPRQKLSNTSRQDTCPCHIHNAPTLSLCARLSERVLGLMVHPFGTPTCSGVELVWERQS